MWCIVLVLGSGWQVFLTGFESQPEHFRGGVEGRDQFLVLAGQREESAVCFQQMVAVSCAARHHPFSFNTFACSWHCGLHHSPVGCPKEESLSCTQDRWHQQLHVPLSCLTWHDFCGLGLLTVLLAQPRRDNGHFNQLPVCSDRIQPMPRYKNGDGGNCANLPSSHLMALLCKGP